MFEASHIVKHINERQSEEQARAGIVAALADLEVVLRSPKLRTTTPTARKIAAIWGSSSRERWCKSSRMRSATLSRASAPQSFARPSVSTSRNCATRFHLARWPSRKSGRTSKRVLTKIEEHKEYLRVVAEIRARADIRWIPETGGSKQNCDPEKAVATA